jgi:hypothetical protein
VHSKWVTQGLQLPCKLKLGSAPGVAQPYHFWNRNAGLMLELHELSDKELREKLSSGELSDKKATIVEHF